MPFNNEQKKKAYKRLPPDIQDLVMDNETTELIQKLLQKTGLEEKFIDSADNEILYAMYCLQSLDDAIKNIAILNGKNTDSLSELKSILQTKIFSQYKIDIEEFIKINKNELSQTPPRTEKLLVETAITTEVAHNVPHQEPTTDNQQSTANAQLENSEKEIIEEKPKQEIDPVEAPAQKTPPSQHYPGGVDPYREPVE